MLLHEAVDMWLSQHIPTTRESYARPITYMMNLVGPELELEDITPANMVRYSRYIMEREDYALKTKEKHIKTTKTFFNWCKDMDFLLKSPARVVKTPKVPRRVSREKAIDEPDLQAMLAYAESDQSAEGVRNYAMIKFMADTGCRPGGVVTLQFPNLYLDDFKAIVTEKGKARKVAFSPEGAHALRRWLVRRPPQDASPDAQKYVFVTLRGKLKRLTSNYLGTILYRLKGYIKRDWEYQIRRNNPYSTRHRLGHKMADERETPRAIADALGHERIETAQENYVDYEFDQIADKVRKHAVTGKRPASAEDKIIKLDKLAQDADEDTNLDDHFGTQ